MAKKTVSNLDHMDRREVLKVAVGAGLVLAGGAVLGQAQASGLVKDGDVLVYAKGDNAGQPIMSKDVPSDGLVLAFPMDASSKTINKDRKATIVLVKVDPKTLDADTAKRAAEGVVAYSAVCTHQGCVVATLANAAIVCPCHGSQYDPSNAAKVVGGPAPRTLAALPIKLGSGQILAAGDFVGQVGA